MAFGWWISRPTPMPPLPETAAPAADTRSFDDAASTTPSAPSASAAASTAAAAEPIPVGLTEAQWKDLQAALKDHPHRDIELARAVELAAFETQLRHLHEAAASPASAPLPDTRDLARSLLEQLPLRIGNGEMSVPAAQALAESLLDLIYTDPADRQREQAAVRARLGQLTPPAGR